MNYRMIGRISAKILAVEAVFMIPALLICVGYHEFAAALAFAKAMLCIALASAVLYFVGRKSYRGFYAREGLICVGLIWIIMSLLGCLPFYFSGEIPHFIDAFFEIVSGFTTTGASILPEVENLSHGILYWRSFSHWIGGMGVLVFLLAISGRGEQGGYTLHLLRAESPGPDVGKMLPRMKQTAITLYVIYIVLTVLNTVFLLVGGMPLFDSVCTAFGTAGTGGFGIKNDSIAGYSPYLQNVCTVFMLLFGVNFNCYYLLLIGNLRSVLKDEEVRLYFGIVFGSIALIAWNIRHMYATIEETLRHAAFQVATIITTTGYATTDFDLWPSFSKAILMVLMAVGACAGSTGGGIKCARVLLLFKSLRRNIHKVLDPRKVQVVRINNRPVSEVVLENTNAYLAAYASILVFSFLVLSIDGFTTTTNFTAVLSCFNNIGPGLEAVGPTCNYASFSVLSKLVLIMDMLAGRLEIFPILVLFSRSTWRKK